VHHHRTLTLVMGNDNFGNGGYITIYQLVDGIPQNPGSPYTHPINEVPEVLSVDPAAQRLYVAAAFDNSQGDQIGEILGFSYVGTNGPKLTKLPGSPYSPESYTGGYGLAADPDGNFLYVSSQGANSISGFHIKSNGALGQELQGSPYATAEDPFRLTFDAQGGFLYSANVNTVSGYQADATTGALTALPGSPYASGSYLAGMAADPEHNLLYVNELIDQTIWVYNITSSGALVPVPGSPVSTGEDLGSVAVKPGGNLLYVVGSEKNNILGYQVNTETGALIALPGFPVAVGSGPGPMIFDPTGNFLYVGNNQGDSLSAFQVSASGALTPLTGSPYTLEDGYPISMVTVTLP
jgi:6-phosphogluconolactonase